MSYESPQTPQCRNQTFLYIMQWIGIALSGGIVDEIVWVQKTRTRGRLHYYDQ